VVETAVGQVPRVRTHMLWSDRLGAWKARWGVGRMRYTVEPGLYAVGAPTGESPVLVSANYKLSFDRLRRELGGLDAWVLVLDTKGINVWCAAGKGQFGTDELVRRAAAAGLDRVVTHRRLVVPQLGAPGVDAREVRKRSGFRVLFGPVRAEDVRAFLDAGMKATAEMRRVRFGFRDRAVLIPMELVTWLKAAALVTAGFLALGGLSGEGYRLSDVLGTGVPAAAVFLAAYLGGAALGPALLPWLPGRSFSVKGAWVGVLLVAALALVVRAHPEVARNGLVAASWGLMVPAVASFVVMNFTGASTYTSLSGVVREMKVAVPVQAAGAVIGVGLWIGGLFAGGA
jgi:acetyl-CoA decarbonylase/synthase complex subunit gamma